MNPKDRSGAKKPNLSILPLRPLYEVALALYEGARKYGPWNWRDENVDETIYVDAAIRHLNQWVAGEDIDPDSGLPHISKAIAGLVILRDAQHHGCSIDTRRAKQNVDFTDLIARQEAINEKYPNPVGELTEEQAEKAAEAYGIGPETRQVTTKWSTTVADGGSYEIKGKDVNKWVEFRDGTRGRIYQFDDPVYDEIPVFVRDSTDHEACYTVDGRSEDTFEDTHCKQPTDIVKVFHA